MADERITIEDYEDNAVMEVIDLIRQAAAIIQKLPETLYVTKESDTRITFGTDKADYSLTLQKTEQPEGFEQVFGERKERVPMKLQYKFFVNIQEDEQGRSVGFFGYKEGHKLQLAYAGEVEVPGHLSTPEACMEAACDDLFRIFEHPADYRNRSMSVGDVVVFYSDGSDGPVAYACESVGWKQIPLPEGI